MGEIADHYIDRILDMKSPAGYMKRSFTAMAITINNVRFSYCHLFQPQARPGQEPKYSVTILIPKSDAAAKAAIDQAVAEAIEQGVAKCWNGVRPPQPALCIHDGDGPRPSDGQLYGSECRGFWVCTASSKQPPFVVDAQVQNIIDPTQVYSGMWGNVSVSFFPYSNSGKKGIGCGLNGVQKTRDDDPLTARVTAQDAFQPVAQAATPAYGAAMPATPTAGYPGAYAQAPGWGAPTPTAQTGYPGGWGVPAPVPGQDIPF